MDQKSSSNLSSDKNGYYSKFMYNFMMNVFDPLQMLTTEITTAVPIQRLQNSIQFKIQPPNVSFVSMKLRIQKIHVDISY